MSWMMSNWMMLGIVASIIVLIALITRPLPRQVGHSAASIRPSTSIPATATRNGSSTCADSLTQPHDSRLRLVFPLGVA